MYPPVVQKLIDIFSKFPTVGPRTAARFVFYLLKIPKEEIDNLISAVTELKKNIKICGFCFKTFQGEGELCEICKNPSRDKNLLCIIEKEPDLVSIEKIKKYPGIYFILGGTISTLKKEDLKQLRGEELLERIKSPEKFGLTDAVFNEVIIAINPTTEGEATVLYLERLLKKNLPEGRRITRLGRGLPVGGELEYADEETLSSALESRK